MGVRFNKRITLFPWLRANVTKSGVSLTIGPKGKTLNVGSTGVSINVNLGKGIGYSKRIISWKRLNLLSLLGLDGTAAAKKATKGAKGRKKGKSNNDSTAELSLEEALAEGSETAAPNTDAGTTAEMQEQPGCSWGCAVLGCLSTLIIIALIIVIVILLLRDGTIDLSNLVPSNVSKPHS